MARNRHGGERMRVDDRLTSPAAVDLPMDFLFGGRVAFALDLVPFQIDHSMSSDAWHRS
jgi:hypothetical protein